MPLSQQRIVHVPFRTMTNLTEQLRATKQASRMLAGLAEKEVNTFLLRLADALEQDAEKILQANQRDLARMSPEDPKFDRLLLNQERIRAIAGDVRTVAGLPSPVGKTLEEHNENIRKFVQ